MTNRIITLSAEDSRMQSLGERQFSGYASVFGNRNCYGFEIAKGAYDEVLSKPVPLMFYGHNTDTVPIGKWVSMEADEHGLSVVGELTEGIQLAEDVHHALVHGTLNGLSVGIGFDPADFDRDSGVLHRVSDLYEISVVGRPADSSARITEALSAEMETAISALSAEKDIEDFLRDACGLSRSRAKQLMGQFKAILKSQRDAEDDEKRKQQLLAHIARISNKI